MKEIINLSNHLGNVLVTVSDKRECDNGLMMANDFEKVSKEGWREYGTTISIDAGKLYATLAQSAKVYKNILSVPNQSYTLLINQDASSSAIIAQAIAINSSQAETNLGSTTLGRNGSYSFTFTATTTNTRIELINSCLTGTYVLEVATTGQFKAEVLSATDYSAFGAPLPGRTYTASSYRFGFNGMEKDNETYGEGNAYDFGARIYDSRLGRWMSVDPMQNQYPSFSPYNYSINSPIMLGDPDGNWVEVKTTKYKLVDGQKVRLGFVKSIFVKADIIERQVIIHNAKLIDLTGKLKPQEKIDLAKKAEDDISERWSTANSPNADKDGYVTNSKNQKVKVITTFDKPIEVVEKESSIVAGDQVFAIVGPNDSRVSNGESAGEAPLNGGIMYLNSKEFSYDPLNIFAHESGHWGGLKDIKKFSENPVTHIMSWFHSRTEKVGPHPDEYTDFYKSGTTGGVKRHSQEGPGVDLKESK